MNSRQFCDSFTILSFLRCKPLNRMYTCVTKYCRDLKVSIIYQEIALVWGTRLGIPAENYSKHFFEMFTVIFLYKVIKLCKTNKKRFSFVLNLRTFGVTLQSSTTFECNFNIFFFVIAVIT